MYVRVREEDGWKGGNSGDSSRHLDKQFLIITFANFAGSEPGPDRCGTIITMVWICAKLIIMDLNMEHFLYQQSKD